MALAPYAAALEAANEREAAGDARGALDVIGKTPCGPDGAFMWAPWRVDRLGLLSVMAPVVPRWAHARWMVAQCVIQLNRSAAERSDRAVAMAVDALGESLPTLSFDRKVRISDRDWLAHQLAVHDLGGLAAFLASKPAVANLAGDMKGWADAPMGGYRLERQTDHELVWTDLASGEEVTTINIGTAARTGGTSRCVIGRVVACDAVRLFSTAPAGVHEELARAVAAKPSDWLATLKESGDAFVVSALSRGQDAPLFTDVFDDEWGYELIDPSDLEHSGFDDEGQEVEPTREDLDELVTNAILDHLRHRDHSPWIEPALVGAALLCFEVSRDVVMRIGPEHASGLMELSQRLVGVPADLCRQLASSLRQSA